MRLLRRIKIYAAVADFIATRRRLTAAIDHLTESLNPIKEIHQ
jgi:hypothetical protein